MKYETDYKDFISRQYTSEEYAPFIKMEEHYCYEYLKEWIERHPATKKQKWLEIGSGRGAMQDIVEDYTGLDVTDEVAKYYHKKFVMGSAEKLPFGDESFDVIWTCSTYEMIPDIEKALNEAVRVLKKEGILLFAPAWHCRPWAANGYQVRPYSDFTLLGKIYKFLIPLLNSFPVRAFFMFPQRIIALIRYSLNKNTPLIYKKLNPKYDINWQSDVDACNSLDPFMVILWFQARGHICISHNTFLRKILARNGTVEFEIQK